jgi:hypothetical protein
LVRRAFEARRGQFHRTIAGTLAETLRHFAEENSVLAEIGQVISSSLHIDEVYYWLD